MSDFGKNTSIYNIFTVNDRLLGKRSKETAHLSNEEQKMLRKLCHPRRARVFDDDFRQSELRSCIFMIEPLNQDYRDYMGTADRGTHKNYKKFMIKKLTISKIYKKYMIMSVLKLR